MAAVMHARAERQDRHVQAAEKSAAALLAIQSSEGYWSGELTADSTLESDYILVQLWMHPPIPGGVWNPPSLRRIDKAVRALLDRQQPDGG